MNVLVINPGHGSFWMDGAEYVDRYGKPNPRGRCVRGRVWSFDGRWNMPDDYMGQYETETWPRRLVLKVEDSRMSDPHVHFHDHGGARHAHRHTHADRDAAHAHSSKLGGPPVKLSDLITDRPSRSLRDGLLAVAGRGDVYEKSARIVAVQMSGRFHVETDHGVMTGDAGDWLATNHPDDDSSSDVWPIGAARFAASYRPWVDPQNRAQRAVPARIAELIAELRDPETGRGRNRHESMAITALEDAYLRLLATSLLDDDVAEPDAGRARYPDERYVDEGRPI